MKAGLLNNHLPTIQGILAILFWSTSVAFSRRLTEQLGTFTAAGVIYTVAGLLACIEVGIIERKLSKMLVLPRLYLWVCGLLFIAYILLFYVAIGQSASREQVVIVGLVNYLWPGFSLLLSLPILRKRGGIMLIPGIVIAIAGIWQAALGGEFLDLLYLDPEKHPLLPYIFMLSAAIIWALYSNLSRRWAGEAEDGAVPLFLLMSGIVLLFISFTSKEVPHWSLDVGITLGFMSIFPAFLAYFFWDAGVRKGNLIVIASLSNMIPFLSTVITLFVLDVSMNNSMWTGAILVVFGSLISMKSVKD